MYLITRETDYSVFAMFACRVTLTAQNEIVITFKAFIDEACNRAFLATGTGQIRVNISLAIVQLEGSRWNHLDENPNAGTLLIIQMPFRDDSQSGQGFFDVITRNSDSIVLLI